MLTYPITVEADGAGFLVTCPDLPEMATDADTIEEAPARAADAIEEALAGRLSDFEPIPSPSPGDLHCAPVDPYIAIKVRLLQATHAAEVNRAELARRLDWKRNSVDRLFQPRHRTRLDVFAPAFAAVGKRLHFEVESINE